MGQDYNIPDLTHEQEETIAWTRETVENVPTKRWFYKVICFIMGKKKLTYQDMFLIFYGLHKNKLGEKESKEIATQRIISLYEYNNNKLPEGVCRNTES